jgi:hypothetical protein
MSEALRLVTLDQEATGPATRKLFGRSAGVSPAPLNGSNSD